MPFLPARWSWPMYSYKTCGRILSGSGASLMAYCSIIFAMDKLSAFLTGHKVLETVKSKYNGEVVVLYDLAWGTHIKAGGLTQSGGVVEKVWRTALQKIRSTKHEIRNVLILGWGGGSIAKIVREFWPVSKITGVDIDEEMVRLGKKYMKLDKWDVDVHIGDGLAFCEKGVQDGDIYDLICIDLYHGQEYPKQFEKIEFIKLTKRLSNEGGTVIYNRLYYDEKRALAHKFEEMLDKEFEKVDVVFPEANVMFLCSN